MFRDRFQRRETVEGQLAQGIDTATQHRVADAQVQQALGTHQGPGTGGASRGNDIGRPAQLQPFGEEVCRRTQFLLLVVVLGRELLFAQVVRQALAGLVDTRSTGAEHDTDAIAAVSLDRAVDVRADLQRGFQQQLIVATVMARHVGWKGCQVALDRADRQRALRHPAGLFAHAAAVAGKQVAGNLLLVAAQRADQSEGIEVSRHGVSPLRGVT
ncbi:hypothetical protein D3C73_967390 [compost metagenome]